MRRFAIYLFGLLAIAAVALASLPSGVKSIRDIPYAHAGDTTLLLDLYLPVKAHDPLPVVVHIHGGSWSSGSKSSSAAELLVTRGFAVASIDYRFSQEVIFPAQMHDCKAAVRWLRANAKKYGLNGARIGAWGTSAGAHLAALLGVSGGVPELEGRLGHPDQSSRVQAVCDFYGPSDLVSLVGAHGDDPRNAVSRLLGGAVNDNLDKAKAASPLTYVDKDDAPVLILHGDRDSVVPVSQSKLFHEALQKAGVESTLRIVPGAGHGFRLTQAMKTQIIAFFEKHLKP
ncbi:MAG: alpha/beta hydrolase fold domain-containing protein [Armatimonadota bacterium]